MDTTGAGDGFLGGFLQQVLGRGKPLEEWTVHEPEASIRFANAVGALVVTRPGAIPAMPALAEVRALLGHEMEAGFMI